MPKVKSIVYMRELVDNKDRRFGSALTYNPAYVELPDKTTVPALFTSSAIEDAIQRAKVNPEDVGEREGFIERIFNPVEDDQ